LSGDISTLFVKFIDQLADLCIKLLYRNRLEFISFKLHLYNIYALEESVRNGIIVIKEKWYFCNLLYLP
jgi:hypothetical protein